MDSNVCTSVECNGPLDLNISVSGHVMLDLSKLKVIIPGAPAQIGGGFKIGGSSKSNLKGGASAQANLKKKFIHGGVSGLLGGNGKGSLHGGGFAFYGDKIVGADGEIHGNAEVLGKTVLQGDIGVGKVTKGVLNGTKCLTGAGEYCGGASVNVATNEDALAYVEAYGIDLKGGVATQANLKDKLIHGGVSGTLGGNGKGSLHGGGFARYGDKIVGADGEIHGNAGVLGKTVLQGDIGVGKDVKGVINGTKCLTGAGEYCGGASVNVATNEDALAYVEAYRNDTQCQTLG